GPGCQAAPPWSRRYASDAGLIQPSTAKTLPSNVFRTAARSTSSSGPATGLIPALLTSRSSRPNVASAASTVSAWWAGSSALPATPSAYDFPPSSSTAAASGSGLRAVRTTRYPSRTSRPATASPIPRLAPVTIATRSSMRPPSLWLPAGSITPVPVPPGVDIDRLTPWLLANVPSAEAPFEVTLIAGGRSNLTYLIVHSGQSMVLRRPPLGHVLATA